MSRRRRAALLLGLALVLGGLAASDVSRREAALRTQLGPDVEVLVAARPLAAGRRLTAADLSVRRMPERFAPPGGPVVPELLTGRRTAVPVDQGGPVTPLLLEQPEPAGGLGVRKGERAAEVTAAAAPGTVVAGSHVDVLVTRERQGTRLALQDVEVLGVRPAPEGKLAATLRVTPAQAVFLADAGAFAREIRLLGRAPGDRAHAS